MYYFLCMYACIMCMYVVVRLCVADLFCCRDFLLLFACRLFSVVHCFVVCVRVFPFRRGSLFRMVGTRPCSNAWLWPCTTGVRRSGCGEIMRFIFGYDRRKDRLLIGCFKPVCILFCMQKVFEKLCLT